MPAAPGIPSSAYRNYSIYRGHAQTGIGEGPGRSVPAGEQYMYADPPLASDATLLSAIRPWMTLDWLPTDERHSRLEAWSYFSHGDFRFVARLVFGGLYDRRVGYFAHARAWKEEAFHAGRDPGALLGSPRLFDEPWRDGLPAHTPKAVDESELQRPIAPVEPEVAARLLGHLYESRVRGRPVIMAVPITDFVNDSPLHAIARFARAALPLSIKRDLSVRIYTRIPDLYLRHLDVGLLVIPEDHAGVALAARRDAVLLDRTGHKNVGPEADAGAVRYADAVTNWALKMPAGLLAFTDRISGRRWAAQMPTPPEVEEAVFVYNLAAKTGNVDEMDDLLQKLLGTLSTRTTAMPWKELLQPTDLDSCSDTVLVRVILADATTQDVRELRAAVEDAATRRRISADSRIATWWSGRSPGGEAARRLLALVNRDLVSDAVAAKLIRDVNVNELALVATDEANLARLLRFTADLALSPDWLITFLSTADGPTLVSLARSLLPVASRQPRLRPLASQCLARLLDLPPLPEILAGALVDAAPEYVTTDLEECVRLAELLHRAGSSRGALLIAELTHRIDDREDRRRLVRQALDNRWTCLDTVEIPESWIEDVVDLLVGAPAWMSRRRPAELLRLKHAIAPAHVEYRRRLVAAIDQLMKRDPIETTAELIRARWWLSWRLESHCAREDYVCSAKAWLRSAKWTAKLQPYLEEWKQVIGDLRHQIGPAEVGNIPWITGFEAVQADDLSNAVSDPVALAILAMAADPVADQTTSRVLYQRLRVRMEALPTPARAAATRDLLVWLCDTFTAAATIPHSLVSTLSAVVRALPVPAVVHSHAYQLAAGFYATGHRELAAALSKDLVREQGTVSAILNALSEGRTDAQAWQDVAVSLQSRVSNGSTTTHPVMETVLRLHSLDDETRHDCEVKGWAAFSVAARRYQLLLAAEGDSLPALQLAAALCPDLGAGNLAIALIELAAHARKDVSWWRALFASLRDAKRHHGLSSSFDRPAVAWLLVIRHGRSLERRDASAYHAMREAMKRMIDPTVTRQ